MNKSIILDKKNLLLAAKHFYKVSGMKIVIFNTKYEAIIPYPKRHCDLCEYIRSCDIGERRCQECDAAVKDRLAANNNQPCIYECHAGLTECAFPIRLHQETLGYIIVGQCLPAEGNPQQMWNNIVSKCADYIDLRPVKKYFDQLPCITKDDFQSYIYIANMLIGHILQNNYIGVRYDSQFLTVDEYIRNHLGDELSAESISEALKLPRNNINTTIRDTLGLSLTQYIQLQRLNYAKELLRETDETITEIASWCGIKDYNYFTRLFRKYFEITPTAYRKSFLEIPKQ